MSIKCSQCGSAINDDGQFCPFCGAVQNDPAKQVQSQNNTPNTQNSDNQTPPPGKKEELTKDMIMRFLPNYSGGNPGANRYMLILAIMSFACAEFSFLTIMVTPPVIPIIASVSFIALVIFLLVFRKKRQAPKVDLKPEEYSLKIVKARVIEIKEHNSQNEFVLSTGGSIFLPKEIRIPDIYYFVALLNGIYLSVLYDCDRFYLSDELKNCFVESNTNTGFTPQAPRVIDQNMVNRSINLNEKGPKAARIVFLCLSIYFGLGVIIGIVMLFFLGFYSFFVLLFSGGLFFLFFKLYLSKSKVAKSNSQAAADVKLFRIVKTRIESTETQKVDGYLSLDAEAPSASPTMHYAKFRFVNHVIISSDSYQLFSLINKYPQMFTGQECYYFEFNGKPLPKMYLSYVYRLSPEVQKYCYDETDIIKPTVDNKTN